MRGPGVMLQEKLETSRSSILAELQHPDITLVLSWGNVGDYLIWEGTRKLLASGGVKHQTIPLDDLDKTKSGGLGVFVGGGAWCRWYCLGPLVLPRLEEKFDRVVVLPSTFDLQVPAVRGAMVNSSATFFAREPVSYEQMSEVVGDRVSLALDGAFFYDWEGWKKRNPVTGKGTLKAFRTDAESLTGQVPVDNRDISNEHLSVDTWLKDINKHAEVWTDRAHVLIAAALLGKKVKWQPDGYHKVEAIAKWAFEGSEGIEKLCLLQSQ